MLITWSVTLVWLTHLISFTEGSAIIVVGGSAATPSITTIHAVSPIIVARAASISLESLLVVDELRQLLDHAFTSVKTGVSHVGRRILFVRLACSCEFFQDIHVEILAISLHSVKDFKDGFLLVSIITC